MPHSFTIEQYRTMLRINRHRLDEELELQAELMDRISSQVAVLNSQQLEAKEELSRIEARLFLELKGDKVSNEAANAEVRKHRERITAWQRYQVARQTCEDWQGLLSAWTARGYHIKVIADLFIAQYFAVTTVHGPEDSTVYADARKRLSEAREERRDKDPGTYEGPQVRRRS